MWVKINYLAHIYSIKLLNTKTISTYILFVKNYLNMYKTLKYAQLLGKSSKYYEKTLL